MHPPPSPDQLRAFLKGQTGALPWGREGQRVPQLQLSYGWLGDAPLGVNAEGGLQLRLLTLHLLFQPSFSWRWQTCVLAEPLQTAAGRLT